LNISHLRFYRGDGNIKYCELNGSKHSANLMCTKFLESVQHTRMSSLKGIRGSKRPVRITGGLRFTPFINPVNGSLYNAKVCIFVHVFISVHSWLDPLVRNGTCYTTCLWEN